MASAPPSQGKGFLFDIKVLELADQRGEFCGKLMAGAGADVVKVEPPGGNPTRRIGPFYQDREDPERSLYFWHYNHGKRGITLDVRRPEGQELLRELVPRFDVVIETFPAGYLEGLGIGYAVLSALNPRLVMASITPFGQSGPRRDWKSSDLVSLALGGVMMNCGYDPMPEGEYDTPPIAPQMWHASHITCNQTNIAIAAALLSREQTGKGQYIDAPMHQAIAANTEQDVPAFVYTRNTFYRQTGKHAGPAAYPTSVQTVTKDGRYVHTSPGAGHGPELLVELLIKHGLGTGLDAPKFQDVEYLRRPEVASFTSNLMRQWVASYKFDKDLWKEGQDVGYHWAPIRRPEENPDDPHWQARKTFSEVYHGDIDRTLTHVGAPWVAEECPWREGPRAPHLGEHNHELFVKELGLPQARFEDLKKGGVI